MDISNFILNNKEYLILGSLSLAGLYSFYLLKFKSKESEESYTDFLSKDRMNYNNLENKFKCDN